MIKKVILLSILLVSFISFPSKAVDYYQKMEKKCETLTKIVKPIVIKKKYEKLCDMARWCFKRHTLVTYTGAIPDIVCDTPVCFFGDKYCLSNCECNAILRKLKVINRIFSFH